MPKPTRKRLRRYVLRALLILVCVVVGWFVVNRLMSGSRAVRVIEAEGPRSRRAAFAGRLRIGCYNIAHGRGTAESNWHRGQLDVHLDGLRAIGRLLADERLDLVVLNEVDFASVWTRHINQAEVIAEAGGFPFRVEHRHYDAAVPWVSIRFGNAVLSRHPVRRADVAAFPGRSAWRSVLLGRKTGLLCEIALPDTRRIRLLAVHLDPYSEPVRVASAGRIEAVHAESSLPVVVAGDFNSTPVDFPCATPDPEGTTAMSVLFETGHWRTLPADTPTPADLTFSTMKPQSVIDWVLVPPDWKILSKKLAGGELSDHYAVIMEVEIPGGAAP